MKLKYATLVLIAFSTVSTAQHYTRGYVRRDGTYVQPHMSTNPNSTKLDNWSTKGNVNPYTGKQGTIDPYKPSTTNPYGSPYNQPRRSNSSGW